MITQTNVSAQLLTREDSLVAGLSVNTSKNTILSGYGEVKYEHHSQLNIGTATVTRNVLFLGHRFNQKILMFSELELENARVTANGLSGEIGLEQLLIRFGINRELFLQAGLFTPRIGIINENHLPTTYNGNDRPYTEQLILPSTWREIGIGMYYNPRSLSNLNLSFGMVNGLNATQFKAGTGIREGRGEGIFAPAKNLALTAAVLYYLKNWRLQTSVYYGGAVGLSNRKADSIGIASGAFNIPVGIVEANAQYRNKGFTFKALGSVVSIPDAGKINIAYANNTAQTLIGSYLEVAYNLLYRLKKEKTRELILFGRYEYVDLGYKMPENGIYDGRYTLRYWITGVQYHPVTGVSIKLDYRHVVSGQPNAQLIINPYPQLPPIYTHNDYLQLGVAYSF